MSENCKSLVLQDKSNIEIYLSPDLYNIMLIQCLSINENAYKLDMKSLQFGYASYGKHS